ncbi:hypothetical protein SARC_12828 [Sphaeroforma arctica JP610]|uniref:Uncharacterized protein n=1 Tax=Sphaeroforma arctica JP610 TaxID=667725 RepID=A0A0L0FDV2_9EUKA|nr:hypothetical protein SARC_12828 [Sphaeroforma arctica JP610]KNC74631.1 hypothetical protein SARC_12828 [Sphaeroforma arctica JP610]|eukprot:XP_014148533.1 hypothetical protein SARC_12828 [Sphaeroforma arctica JP610]
MLCFVCFEMHYTGVGLIGSYTINLDTMKQGYRYVYLEDNEGTALSPVALFVHLRLETKPAYDYRKNDEARQKVAARAAGTQAPPNALASKTSAPLHHSNSVPAQHYSPTNGHVNGNTSAHRQQSYNAPGFMMPPPAFQCSPQPPQPPHAQQQHQPPPLPYAQPQPSPQAPSHTHAQNTQQPQQANQYPPQPHYAPALPPRPSPRAQQPIQPQYQYAPPTAYSYGGPPPHPNAPMPRGYQPNEASPSPVHQTLPHPSTPHPHPQSQSYQQQRPPSYGLGPESRLTHNPRPPQHHSPTTTVACPYCTVQFEGVAGTTMTCHVCLGVFTG